MVNTEFTVQYYIEYRHNHFFDFKPESILVIFELVNLLNLNFSYTFGFERYYFYFYNFYSRRA